MTEEVAFEEKSLKFYKNMNISVGKRLVFQIKIDSFENILFLFQ